MKATRALCCALLPAHIFAASAVAQPLGDARLAADIAHVVNGYVHFSIFDDVRSGVENGEVVLRGKVTTPLKKREIEKRLVAIEGVRAVRNEIAVLPPSPSDDHLRYRAARAIYGHPSFWRHAARAHPPIRIIVEDGRVTLKGVVGSSVERVLAASLATGLGELSVINELTVAGGSSPPAWRPS